MSASMKGEMQPAVSRFKFGDFEIAKVMDSKVVREGLRVLEATYLRRKKRGIIGLGKFESRVRDLGSSKKHLRDFGR